jgi:hypothetical protein
MIAFAIRSILTAGLLFLTVFSFYTGYWGWGIVLVLLTAIVGLTFIFNENLAFSLNHMRTGNQEKARHYINKITHPEFLPKRQRAYVIYLQAMFNAQDIGFAKSEMLLRKAIALGLRRGHDQAMARLHLAGVCAQTGRKTEALNLLAEAKKLDNTGMMKDQIKMMQSQLQNAPSKNQMRMAQMMGGRKKTPRMR